MGQQLAICCEKREKLRIPAGEDDFQDFRNDYYQQLMVQQDREAYYQNYRGGNNPTLTSQGSASEPISPFHNGIEQAKGGKGKQRHNGSFVYHRKGQALQNIPGRHTNRVSLGQRGKYSTRDETLSDNQDDRQHSVRNKQRVKNTLNFINKKITQMQDDDDSFKYTETPGGILSGTPGEGLNDSFTSSNDKFTMDEENVVLFHDKCQIEKFFSDLPKLQNYFYLQSGRYYVPSILCNSPRDLREEAMIVLRNCDLLQNYQIKHMKSSKLAENFKIHHFAFLDNKPINWKDQLLNDLKNFCLNDGLELIGAINDYQGFSTESQINQGPIGKSFQLLFYKQPKYNKSLRFNFFIEIIYEDMQQKELQEFINKKALEESGVFRTCLTVYEKPKRKKVNGHANYNDKGQLNLEVFCHILVFEKRKDEDEEKFTMVFKGSRDYENDPSIKINEFLYREELCQKFRIAGFLPKNSFEESLFIFSAQ